MTSNLHSGVYKLQVSLVNDSGYPVGQATGALSNGTVYPWLVVPGVVSYTPAQDTTETAFSFAQQNMRGRRDMGISALGDGTLELSEFDDVFDPLVMGYTRDTSTATALVMTGHNVNRGRPRKVMLAFTAAATPVDSTPEYVTIFTWGTLRRGALGANQQSGRNPNNKQYILTKTLSTRTPFGQLYSAATIAPDSDTDDEFVIKASAPISGSTYVDDGNGTSIVLPYAPDSTEHAGATNIFFKQGVTNHSNVSGISSATLTVTAGTAADIWNILVPSLAIL